MASFSFLHAADLHLASPLAGLAAIFASFDGARTGHGLEALAAIGGIVQPILFTHHDSVARIAQARPGAAVDIVAL